MNNLSIGHQGEEIACWYLKQQGYTILERNFRIQGGEIDIVAKDQDYMVFVEVKMRNSHKYGLPVEAITPWKIKHLLKSAQFYLMKIDYGDGPYRLDAVLIDFVPDSSNPKIELIKNITEF